MAKKKNKKYQVGGIAGNRPIVPGRTPGVVPGRGVGAVPVPGVSPVPRPSVPGVSPVPSPAIPRPAIPRPAVPMKGYQEGGEVGEGFEYDKDKKTKNRVDDFIMAMNMTPDDSEGRAFLEKRAKTKLGNLKIHLLDDPNYRGELGLSVEDANRIASFWAGGEKEEEGKQAGGRIQSNKYEDGGKVGGLFDFPSREGRNK